MNRVLLVVLLMLFVKLASAQDYITKGVSPDLHLTHKVAARETWFAIAKTYNLTPKQIASYNNLNVDRPLDIGQTIRIPLTSANFTQSDTKAADEVLVPVYHIVQEKEWMYRVSVSHNKVPIERLEKWNSITRDQAKAGMKLIVGHLRVKGGNDSQALSSVQKGQQPAQQPATTSQSTATPQAGAATIPGTRATVTGNAQTAPVGNGGYFRGLFNGQGKTQSGVSGIFKSTSGWNDGKYYALMNNITVGTIVRITFPQTNKSIFAKVLGELPDMKESAGLALRISDAAAKELGAVSSKFSVDVAY